MAIFPARFKSNPLETYNDDHCCKIYRFRREDILWIADEFGESLEFKRKGGSATGNADYGGVACLRIGRV